MHTVIDGDINKDTEYLGWYSWVLSTYSDKHIEVEHPDVFMSSMLSLNRRTSGDFLGTVILFL